MEKTPKKKKWAILTAFMECIRFCSCKYQVDNTVLLFKVLQMEESISPNDAGLFNK